MATRGTQRRKRVIVVVRRPLGEPRAAQALRAAVGYTTVGLEVTVALCGAAAAAPSGALPAAVQRHLGTLQALGQRLLRVDEQQLCALLVDAAKGTTADSPAAAVIVW